jgi:hypothetical protein
MDIYSATPPVAKKRRKYSKEFKLSIVNACKNPNFDRFGRCNIVLMPTLSNGFGS